MNIRCSLLVTLPMIMSGVVFVICLPVYLIKYEEITKTLACVSLLGHYVGQTGALKIEKNAGNPFYDMPVFC